MNAGKLARVVVVGLVLLGGARAGAKDDPIKIGIIAALTGGGAPWGQAAAGAAKLAAAEVNANGGLEVGGKKYRVEVIAYDDHYTAADALAAYNRLVNQDGARNVVLMASAGTMAVKQHVEDDKVIALTTSYSAKALDANTKFMFRLFSVARDYDPALIAWMKGHYKERRVAIVNPNDETGWDQDQLTGRLYKDNGYEVVGRELYERTVTDFQPLFTKIIVGSKPDLIDLGSTSPATAGLMIRQARELGYKGLFAKTGGAGPKDIVAAAGKAAEGMISILYADPTNAGYRHIAAEYRKAYGQDPNEILVCYYDATKVLLRAIQKASNPADTAKIAAAFAQALPMKSVQGDTLKLGGKATIGADQQIMTTMYVGVIKNGEPVAVDKVAF